jgi:predicted ribosome quality control (RQC) complex YloA/Tae2 family protein
VTGDLYVHADLHGATSVIIKNPSGKNSQNSGEKMYSAKIWVGNKLPPQ